MLDLVQKIDIRMLYVLKTELWVKSLTWDKVLCKKVNAFKMWYYWRILKIIGMIILVITSFIPCARRFVIDERYLKKVIGVRRSCDEIFQFVHPGGYKSKRFQDVVLLKDFEDHWNDNISNHKFYTMCPQICDW